MDREKQDARSPHGEIMEIQESSVGCLGGGWQDRSTHHRYSTKKLVDKTKLKEIK